MCDCMERSKCTIASGAMRIKLPTRIAGGDIHGRQVTDTRNLDVIGRLDEVSTFDRARWNKASAISGLRAERQGGRERFTSATYLQTPGHLDLLGGQR